MNPLVLQQPAPSAFLAWEAALRVGRPVHWMAPTPSGWLPSELGPLAMSSVLESRAFRPPVGSRTGDAVTAVIPTHRRVPWGVRALRAQRWSTQVLVVSNGRGPTSIPGCRVWRTAWTGHADTRRRALDHVSTPHVLLLSDDAIPLGTGFVEQLVLRLVSSGADAVVARQVPWPTAPQATRRALRAWTPPVAAEMPHADHVATLYRTNTLRRLATEDVPIAEDLVWTLGRHVVCAPHAPVLHSHHPSLRERFGRRVAEHAVRARHGMHLPVRGVRSGLQALPGAWLDAEDLYDALLRTADVVGMAVGARRGRSPG